MTRILTQAQKDQKAATARARRAAIKAAIKSISFTPAPVPVVAPAPAVSNQPKKGGKLLAVYEAVLAHPKLSAKELYALGGLDSSLSTVEVVRADFIRSVNFMASKGMVAASPF